METRNKRKKREANTKAGPSVQVLGQVIKLKRPGVTTNAQLNPSTSGILDNQLTRKDDRQNPTPAHAHNDKLERQHGMTPLTPLCAACDETPRIQKTGFSVLQCHNGHIICTTCRTKIKSCPNCRSTEMDNRNLFVEDYIKRNMQHKPHKCRNDPCIVNIRMHSGDLAAHEAHCIYREGDCPNRLCDWHGNLSNLLPHIQDKNCAHIRLDTHYHKRNTQPTFEGSHNFHFKNQLMFPNKDPNIFRHANAATNFKPIILIGNGITNLYCYLIIARNAGGTWTFMVYCTLDEQDTEHVKVTLRIGDEKTNYTHQTKIISYQENNDRVREKGNFMALNDDQIKRLNEGTQLFNFEVTIHPDQNFIREANTNANMGRQ